MVGRLFFYLVLAFTLIGCATTRRADMSADQTQMRISQLEEQLSQKEEEISDLKNEIQTLSQESSKEPAYRKLPKYSDKDLGLKNDSIIRIDASVDQVQLALKKAGYYNGPVDGKIGQKTKRAIADFQKSRNLTADGVVGRKTWDELKTYLE